MALSPHRHRLSPLAESDLEDIWLYTFKRWSGDQADRYLAEINDAFAGLASGARAGRAVTVREGLLKCTAGAHVVYYRVEDTGIVIVRVLHGRMDAERHLPG